MITRLEHPDGLVGYRSPRLEEWAVPHLFTTRIGAGRALDLRDLPATGWAELARRAGAEGRTLVRARQVHGSVALRVGPGPLPAEHTPADALVTERADVLLCVHVADCVPVLLAADGGRRVAAVHAGWRGLVAGVLPRALEALAGTRVRAAIGPCISRAHFEVGPEVVQAFVEAGLARAVEHEPGRRDRIDLRAAVEDQLRRGGVSAIDGTDRCTYEHAGEYWSHRRDVTHGHGQSTGRLGALIAVSR